MKRTLIFLMAALSLLVTVGYPAGAWYVGKQMETTLGDQYKSLHDSTFFLSVVDRKFKRGIFSSEETVTLNVTPVPGATPLRLTVTSRIKHLPLPGIFMLETAAIDSEVAFADRAMPEVAEWTGGQDLAAIHTAYYLNGSGNMDVTIPAFNSARLSSDQATLNFKFAKDMAGYSMKVNVPRFAIINKMSGERLQLSGMQIDGDHKRFLAGPPSMFSGSDHIVIDQIDASGGGMPVEPGFIKHVTVDATAVASSDNQFVDITEKFGLGSIKIMGKDYGPAKFEMTLSHLHAKSIADFSRAGWLDAAKDPAFATKYVEAILTHNPEFRIDRFSFTQPEGETVVSALFKMKDAQPGDFNPMAMLNKGYVSVDFKMPEKVLSEFGQGLAPVSMQGGGLDKELEKMLAEGYVTREDGYIKTKFEFHDATPWFNGKQYVRPASAVPPAPALRRR